MNAPPFPLNPAINERFGNWVWNGARWVCSASTGVRVIHTTFTAAGPYQPSPGLVTAVAEVWGAGGGGGGAQPGSSMPTMGGGGGGSGGYSKVALDAALVAGGVNVTIGAGGPGGTVEGSPGGHGGVTSFGAFAVANGGGGGTTAFSTASVASSGYGGAPGAAGVGDIAFAGNAGQTGGYALPGEEVEVVGGLGGAGPGSGGVANLAATLGGTNVVVNGPPGLSPAAGGGGGASANQTANAIGGVGASGFCLVTEYCWNDGSESDCCNPNTLDVNARVAVTHVPFDPCPPGNRPYVDPRGGYDE
jgi:hypothetical protein